MLLKNLHTSLCKNIIKLIRLLLFISSFGVFLGILCILLGIGAIYLPDPISHGKVWAIVLISLVGCLAILVLMSLGLQPHSTKKLAFKVQWQIGNL